MYRKVDSDGATLTVGRKSSVSMPPCITDSPTTRERGSISTPVDSNQLPELLRENEKTVVSVRRERGL